VDMVHSLLERHAKIDLTTRDGFSALMGACLQGHPGVVKRLLHAQANTELKASHGATALDLAGGKMTPAHVECTDLISLHSGRLVRWAEAESAEAERAEAERAEAEGAAAEAEAGAAAGAGGAGGGGGGRGGAGREGGGGEG